MDKTVSDLITNAKAVSMGLIKVAAAKPNEHLLQSNAQTFRGAATILYGLSEEVTRIDAVIAGLHEKLSRIATLEVRGAAEAIETGDWKAVVDELQAVAQEALTPRAASRGTRPRGRSGSVPRRPAA